MKHTVTTEWLAQTLYGGPAADVFESAVEHDGQRWFYPDATAPDGKGWPARQMTGKEPITLVVDGGRVVATEGDAFVTHRFGRPGACIGFGARDAARVAAALASVSS